MTVSIAPPPASPPVTPPARRAPPTAASDLPPREPVALLELWPPGVLPPQEASLLARPYLTGRSVPAAQSKCGTCIALCCRYIAFEVDGPTEPKDFELLRWFLLHEGTQLFVEGRTWYLQVFVRCRALGADYRCTIYDTRPEICRSYEADGCDRDEAEKKARIDKLFRSPEELEAWRVTWMKRWEAKRRKVRREAAVKAARTRARRRRAMTKGATAGRSQRR
jgi:uncharacterized protein